VATAAVMLAIGSTAAAQDRAAFERWDRNDNGKLSTWELKQGIGYVSEWPLK